MSRIRTIKPSYWISEQVMECSRDARLLFIGLWNFADDNGVHPASAKTLKAEVFPGDDLTAAEVQSFVDELLKQGLLVEFKAEGRLWWFVTGWHHQLINRPSPSRYPLPPREAPQPKAAGLGDENDAADTESLIAHGSITEDSVQEGKGKEGKGREEEGSVPAPARHAPARSIPLPDDFAISPATETWAEQHGYDRLPEHLEAFKGKALAKDYRYANWQQAFRNAVRDDWAGLRKAPPAAPGGGRATGRAYDPASKRAALAEHNGGALSAWLGGVSPTAAIPALALETDHATH